MRPVTVNVNPFDFFGIEIAGDVVALFQHQNFFAPQDRFMRANGAEQAAPDNQNIIFFNLSSAFLKVICLFYHFLPKNTRLILLK